MEVNILKCCIISGTSPNTVFTFSAQCQWDITNRRDFTRTIGAQYCMHIRNYKKK
jgi:hypothetical protein